MGKDSGLIHASVIVSAITIVYLNSLSGVFLFDDESSIVNNVAIRDLWSLDWFQLRGRPVTTLTIAINYAIGGLDPIGYHVVNIAIHIANGLLLYEVIVAAIEGLGAPNKRSPRDFAFASTLLWAVHPLCTQSVTYIIQRSEALAALGILATLYCWSRGSQVSRYASGRERKSMRNENAARTLTRGGLRGWSIAAVAFAMVAYGSKESAAFLPIIVLLYDRIFFSQSWRAVRSRAMWHVAMGLPVLVGVGVYATLFVGGEHQDQTVGFSMDRINPWSYLASQPFAFAQYLWLSVLPIKQSMDYGWLPSENQLTISLGLSLWFCIVLLAVWLLIRKPLVGFLLAASLLILAPSSSFMPLQDIIFEHRFYLPLAAVCMLFVGIWDQVGSLISSRFNIVIGYSQKLAGVAVLVAFGLLTMARNRDYFSSERMFASDAARNPENPRALANLAAARDFDNPDDCIAMYAKALQLYEERGFFYAGTRYKLTRAIGDIYFLTGRPEAASRYFSQSLASANDVQQEAEVHFSLAMIASANGEAMDADRHFAFAIDKANALPGLHEAYAVHLRRTGREAMAVAEEEIAQQQMQAMRKKLRANR